MSDFIFVGGALAFDFVNTQIIVRRKPQDLLVTVDDLARWWDSAQAEYPNTLPVFEPTPEILASLVALRASLRRLFTAYVEHQTLPTDDLERLNQVLAQAHPQLVQRPDGIIETDLLSALSNSARPLVAIALDAVEILTQYERARVHHCGNPHCILFFYDRTRSATRTYCSADCQNRAHAAQKYSNVKRVKQIEGMQDKIADTLTRQ